MNLIFLDTETTGQGKEDRLIQVAYLPTAIGEDGLIPAAQIEQGIFKAEVPTSLEAMSVHHITQDITDAALGFGSSYQQKALQEYVAAGDVLVAHNATFDLSMLEKEGVRFTRFIDTLRVARHLLDAPNYKLQFLRYYLAIQAKMTENHEAAISAHDAAGDVTVLLYLFYELIAVEVKAANEKLFGSFSIKDCIEKFIKLSTQPVKLKTLPYGKYFGKTFEEVAVIDRRYLVWMENTEKEKLDQNPDLIYTLSLLA